jgi:hypothetical protein
MQLVWGSPHTPSRYYSFFLHLYSESGGEISPPISGQPPLGDDRPTITWTVPSEILAAPPQTWNIPQDLAPGTYELWLGVFEPISGDRLSLSDGQTHAVLTTITVKDCSS